MCNLEAVMKTRKYKKASDLATKFEVEHLVIDICSAWNRNKSNLENILCHKNNTILITDISALGRHEEIVEVYRRIVTSGNDLLICYYNAAGCFEADELSTVTLDLNKKANFSLEDNLEKIACLSTTEYRVNGCKMADPNVIEAYWRIEHGLLTVKDAINELNISRSTFERRIAEYIGTEGWIQRYEHEIVSSDIAQHPTKLGRVSDEAKLFHAYLEANVDQEHSYEAFILASFAGLHPDLWEQLCDANSSDPPPQNHQQLYQKYYVLAHHHYREVIRYRKYLALEKYKKSKR
jgi:predicted transposase YbfD/YdcC